MKLLLGSFIACLGDLPKREQVLSSILPPLGRDGNRFNVDCSLLLSADKLIYDSESLTLLRSLKEKDIDRICDSIEILGDAGLLVLENFCKLADPVRGAIEQAVETTTRDFSIWVPHIKNQIETYDAMLPDFSSQFAATFTDWDHQIFGIAQYLMTTTGAVRAEDAAYIRQTIMQTNRRRRAADENQLLRNVIRPGIEAVYTNLHLANALDSVPYSWITLKGYYDQALVLAARNYSEKYRSLKACSQFFTVAFPEFRPYDTRAWVKLLKSSKLSDLRNRISEAIASEESIDAAFAQRAVAEFLNDKGRLEKRKTMSARLALPASLAGGVAGGALGGILGGVGGLLGGIGGSLIPEMIKSLADHAAERNIMSKHGWLYFMSDR